MKTENLEIIVEQQKGLTLLSQEELGKIIGGVKDDDDDGPEIISIGGQIFILDN